MSLRSCGSCVAGIGCWSRRTRCCAGRRRICRRRTCREKALPARERARRRRDPRGGDVPGTASSPASPTTGGGPTRSPTPNASRRYRANALFDAHRDDPEFGYRYLVEEARDAGEPMAERTAWRICADNRWWSVFGKKRGKNGKSGPPVHDDLVERDFTARCTKSVVAQRYYRASRPVRASSTCVRSRTCSPTASWATRSTPG